MKNIVCPISSERVDENVVRITALLTAALIILYLLTGVVYFVVAAMLDFFIRGFTSLKPSPFSWVALRIARSRNLPEVPVDKAPKLFAARLGFIFCILIILMSHLIPVVGTVLCLLLTGFALLEGIFRFCAGCLVYNYLVLPFLKKG